MPGQRLRPLASLCACAFLVSACGGGGGDNGKSAAGSPTAAAKTDTGCQKVSQPAPKTTKLPKPKEQLDPSKTYVATVSTTCGDFQITLDAKRAPRTGGSFKYLADKGFYDNTTFHRIDRGFVIQGGDPQGNGNGGPGYKIVEAPPKDSKYVKGVVGMAKTQLDESGTSGSQFFVVTANDAQLPPEYALLGKVTGGMDVVDRIEASDTDKATEKPLEPIVIRSITVAEK